MNSVKNAEIGNVPRLVQQCTLSLGTRILIRELVREHFVSHSRRHVPDDGRRVRGRLIPGDAVETVPGHQGRRRDGGSERGRGDLGARRPLQDALLPAVHVDRVQHQRADEGAPFISPDSRLPACPPCRCLIDPLRSDR